MTGLGYVCDVLFYTSQGFFAGILPNDKVVLEKEQGNSMEQICELESS